MKIPYLICLSLLLAIPATVKAGEWDLNAEGYAQGLYGYAATPHRFDNQNKNNHGVGKGEINLSAAYDFDDDYRLSFNLDINGGVDRDLKSYNQGAWGEEAYVIADSPYGRLMLGQTFNVDTQFHEAAPTAGAIANNNDVVDFISNPNWKRNKHTTKFATLNTTYINTDGVAAKASYITPEIYGTMLGLTYVPDAYNRRGLINKHASYEKDGGFISSLYTNQDFWGVDVKASLGYAEFHDDDKEMSASLQLSRGNWTLGGGYRKTYIDGKEKNIVSVSEQTPELFDNYREGEAWNVGIGYEIGPFKTALSYFEAKASRTDNKDKIVTFSNQYQVNKYVEIYAAAAHVDFEGQNSQLQNNNQGYAFVTGIGITF